jgi:N-methylhydantoinase A
MASVPLDPARIKATIVELRNDVLADLAADMVAEADRHVEFEADLRFGRQISEITRPLPDDEFDRETEVKLVEAFRSEYARRYGQGSLVLGAPVELVAIRAIGIGRTTRAQLAPVNPETVAPGTPAPITRHRPVMLERGEDGRRDIAVHDGGALRPGHVLSGPALIDARDTTIWVPRGMTATVSPQATLVMECETRRVAAAPTLQLEPLA